MTIAGNEIAGTNVGGYRSIDEQTADNISRHVNKPSMGEYIELYDIDSTAIGGGIVYITPNVTSTNAEIVWRGITYSPLPVEADGFEITQQGAQPRPKLRVSNASKFLLSSVISLGDLVGAKVTRWRTFGEFLDNGNNPDPDAHLAKEIFYVYQKTGHNKSEIEWTLRSALDNENLRVPKRQILRDKGFPGVSRIRIGNA
tara:strand:- start:3456 stop:4055 length:600 start_codon:yes stop_codon:yes gene_type:complete